MYFISTIILYVVLYSFLCTQYPEWDTHLEGGIHFVYISNPS